MSEEQHPEEPRAEPAAKPSTPPWIGAVVAVVVVALGIAAAYVLGTNRSDATASTPPTAPADQAQLGVVVSGTGSAAGVPDQLRFGVTVHHSAAVVTDAMNATSADTRKVVRALTAAGVAKMDIRTTSLSVQPNYRYSGGQELISGYSASERIAVRVRDIKIAGTVISSTATAGGNAVRIGGFAMSVANPSGLEEQARNQAMSDARTKAEQFAKAAGRTLGEVVVVEESSAEPAYPTDATGTLDSLARGYAAKRVPIDPGTQTTKVDVTVRWSFSS
jgi:uncharacterized protein YggE